MTGLEIRAANEQVSAVQTSNSLLNKIHNIIDRSIKVISNCQLWETAS